MGVGSLSSVSTDTGSTHALVLGARSGGSLSSSLVGLDHTSVTDYDTADDTADAGSHRAVAMEACAVCATVCDIQLCVQCLSIGYCSRECQKRDWSRHKHECRAAASQT